MLIHLDDKKYFAKTCAICYDTITNYSLCRILPCYHIFHCICISDWLVTKANCPMCKKILKYESQVSMFEFLLLE